MIHVFGIRHHGPGSARSLRQALASLAPDLLLVEGPPEAGELLTWARHPAMQPPVSLLIYAPDQPQRAAYYPLAVFSPEWQAIQFALAQGAPLRFIDLPQATQLSFIQDEPEPVEELPAGAAPEGGVEAGPESASDASSPAAEPPATDPHPPEPPALPPGDPLSWIAAAAGYSDGERWWEHQVEQRQDSRDLFAAILELMTTLRAEVERQETAGPAPGPTENAAANLNPADLKSGLWREDQREAHMRQAIRRGQAEGYQRIAVVCGAWHAPALSQNLDAPGLAAWDAALLADLPRLKVAATWVPWTYGRLSWRSGYGAGIDAPGWFHHLWQAGEQGLSQEEIAIHWLTGAARLLRHEDLDASSAHIIEAVRLAEALASLRGRPLPGLPELNEAVQSVFCLGESLPLRLIQEKLVVSERLGRVPESIPVVPLQADLERLQKRLRLPPEAEPRELDLDLRKPTDLERSHLLHRLRLLDLPWGEEKEQHGKRGTFHEFWRLEWRPEFAVSLIECSVWGNTVSAAANACACHAADEAADLPALTELTGRVLFADLPEAVSYLMQRLENAAALSSDLGQLMLALPPLAEVLRYGNVRQTDAGMLARVVAGLLSRICIGLAPGCAALDDPAAGLMFARLVGVDRAVRLLQDDTYTQDWQESLLRLAEQTGLHGLLAGRVCHLLLDRQVIDLEATAQRMGLALSPANPPAYAAAWLEGFLKDSGALLLHLAGLWQIIDDWVTALSGEIFTQVLPLLRRTFATFTRPERRRMGERAALGPAAAPASAAGQQAGKQSAGFAPERAAAVLPRLAQYLGLDWPPEQSSPE